MGISEVMYSYGLSVFSIILVFLIVYLQLKINKSELRQWCILALTCSLIANISIMFQIVNISNKTLGIFYEAFALIGISIMPICCFFAVCYFIEEDFKFRKRNLFLLFAIPIISIIATFTNDFHGLMFRKFSTNVIEIEYGFLYYILVAYLFVTYLLTIMNILKYLLKDLKKYKYQVALSFTFIIIPAIILFLGNLKLINLKIYANGIIQSLIVIIVIEILLKYQILTVIPVSIMNVLNTITDGFLIIDKNGKIISYNKVFTNMFDLKNLDIRKINVKELIEFREFDTLNEEDIDKITSLKEDDKDFSFERTSDFLKLTLRYDGTRLEKRKDNLYLISIIDITGYSKDIQNIKLNKDALLSKERLASLGQMIGGIAHNLKTPIFSIAGAIEGIEDLVREYRESISDETVTVEDHKDIANDMYEWTNKIQGYLSYMTDIITAIQMQTTTGYGKINDEFTLKELIKYINILMKYELKQNLIDLEIKTEIDEEIKINGNINSLIQVLNNLISNSIQAYSNKQSEKKIILRIYENKKDIIMEITDFAGGIPEDVKNKLFKEMVTTKGKNGTGLGLFISYTSIKTGFGGNLCFSTQEGVGTTFKIIIPKSKK